MRAQIFFVSDERCDWTCLDGSCLCAAPRVEQLCKRRVLQTRARPLLCFQRCWAQPGCVQRPLGSQENLGKQRARLDSLVNSWKFRVVDVVHILRLHSGDAAKVICSSWQQFSGAGSTNFFLQESPLFPRSSFLLKIVKSWGKQSHPCPNPVSPLQPIFQKQPSCTRFPSSLHNFSFPQR